MTVKLRLDKSRDAGQISPPLKHPTLEGVTAHYEQNGLFFDHEGAVLPAFNPDQQKRLADIEAGTVPAVEPKAAKKAAGEKKTASEKRAAAPKQKPSGSDQLNLVGWLMGEEKAQEYRVKKVVRDRYNRVFGNMTDVVQFLVVDQSLVSRDQLSEPLRKLITPVEPNAE